MLIVPAAPRIATLFLAATTSLSPIIGAMRFVSAIHSGLLCDESPFFPAVIDRLQLCSKVE
jgi:hypothetical protein